jgi:hypothetical protein
MKFLCVDPAEFKLKGTDRIEVRNGFFTDDTVEELKSKTEPILFISDIRTGDPKVCRVGFCACFVPRFVFLVGAKQQGSGGSGEV